MGPCDAMSSQLPSTPPALCDRTSAVVAAAADPAASAAARFRFSSSERATEVRREHCNVVAASADRAASAAAARFRISSSERAAAPRREHCNIVAASVNCAPSTTARLRISSSERAAAPRREHCNIVAASADCAASAAARFFRCSSSERAALPRSEHCSAWLCQSSSTRSSVWQRRSSALAADASCLRWRSLARARARVRGELGSVPTECDALVSGWRRRRRRASAAGGGDRVAVGESLRRGNGGATIATRGSRRSDSRHLRRFNLSCGKGGWRGTRGEGRWERFLIFRHAPPALRRAAPPLSSPGCTLSRRTTLAGRTAECPPLRLIHLRLGLR